MIKHDTEIVSALQAALSDKVGRERYDLWFATNARLSTDGNTLRVCVRNAFYQDWLRTHFRHYLKEACREQLGRELPISFEVDAQFAPLPRGAEPHHSTHPAAAAAVVPAPPGAPASDAVSSQQTKTRAAANGDESPRGTPPGGGRRAATLDSFVSGAGNRVALASALDAAQAIGRVSPLVLHGPTGVGKSHLLEGICGAARRQGPRVQAVYLTAEQFTTLFLDALNSSGLPSFRHKYRGVDLLAIDDLQFFAGKKATLVELVNTIDTLRRAGRQLVLAADRPPASLAGLGRELITRLSEGLVCRVDPPDHQVRCRIVRERSAGLRLELAEDVIELVATSFRANVREIVGAINKLHATSRALERPVTLALAQQALCETISTTARPLKLADVQQAVCEVFGLEPTSLCSPQRTSSISQPRMLAMWLARKYTRAGLVEIGQFFGRRSHATVISANKKIGQWMSGAKTVQLAGDALRVDEAIRRVEARLLA